MDSYQLYSILKKHHHTQEMFDSVVASDRMPRDVGHFPSFFICNKSDSSTKGSHWVGLCFPDKNSNAEFFDSMCLGLSAYSDEIVLSLKSNSNGRITTNTVQYQADNSGVCGHYCLWWIDHRCRGFTFETCMKLLSNDAPERNDRMVKRFVERHMTHP